MAQHPTNPRVGSAGGSGECSRRAVLTAALASACSLGWSGDAQATAQCAPQLIVRGMSLPSWCSGTYRSSVYRERLTTLDDMGFNAVAIIPNHFLSSADQSRIIASEHSESLDNVARAVAEARGRGLQVLLKPHLNVEGYASPAPAIDPADKRAFFDDFRALITGYARLAETTGVSFLAVGSELAQLSGRDLREPWLQVIGEARQAFKGPVVYAAHWGEDQEVSFWDALDYIGIDMCAPVRPGQSVEPERMIERWRQAPPVPDAAGPYGRSAYIDLFRSLSQRHRRPILFTEVGVRSVTGALTTPWDLGKTYAAADFALQPAFYQALMRLACDENDGWLAGMFLSGWRFDAAPTRQEWAAIHPIGDKRGAPFGRG